VADVPEVRISPDRTQVAVLTDPGQHTPWATVRVLIGGVATDEWVAGWTPLVDATEQAVTPDKAAALVLYEAAEWVASYRDQMKRGSGDRRAAERIHAVLADRARRRHLGELYDPAIAVSGELLRQELAARPAPVDLAGLADKWEKEAHAIATDGFVPLSIRDKGTPEDAAQWRKQAEAQAYGMNWCAGELRRAMGAGQ
jgi:hypothetical protein